LFRSDNTSNKREKANGRKGFEGGAAAGCRQKDREQWMAFLRYSLLSQLVLFVEGRIIKLCCSNVDYLPNFNHFIPDFNWTY
jgi:hypothetical protein